MIMIGYCSQNLFGWFESLPIGGRSVAMGSAYTGIAEGCESPFFNPAGLSQMQSLEICLFHSQLYGLAELTQENITMAMPTTCGYFGFGLQIFGHGSYRENTYSIGWARKLHKQIMWGILTRIAHLQIRKYGSDTAFLIDTGCLIQIKQKIRFGIAMYNVTKSRMGQQHNPLPISFKIGLGVQAVPEILMAIDFVKDSRYGGELKGGFELDIHRSFALRCGFGKNPSFFAAGFGITGRPIIIDYAFSLHPDLGGTHQASLTFILRSGKTGK